MPARAQQTSGHYFSQTGHNIIGEFWTFYQSVPDAAILFGLPLTEQFPSADGSGLTVQYFEKVRFELHPDQPIGGRVLVSALGTALYKPGLNSINTTSPGVCRVINGFGVCYDFLTYFDQHGGLARFGNPISAFEFQPDGRVVQYFERARFDWHPELPAGQNVMLADLGRLYFNAHEDPAWLKAALPLNNIPVQSSRPLSLRTMVFVANAVTLPSDTQRIFIVVQDQALGPVEGATGTVTIHFPGGQNLSYPVVTDAGGVGVISTVRFSDQPAGGLVTLDTVMTFEGLQAAAATSFRIWR